MNPPQFFALAIVMALPFVTLLTRLVLRHKERMAELQGPQASDPTLHARLDRIEQSVDAIAVEVERIGESQRFLTHVMRDRALPMGNASVGDATGAR